MINYAKDNPGVVVYLKPRRHRSAVISAEYCKLNIVVVNDLCRLCLLF